MDLNTLWLLHNRITMDATQNDNRIEMSLNKYDMTLYDDNKNLKGTIAILKEIDLLYSLLYSAIDTIEEHTQLMTTIREMCIIIIGKRKSKELYDFYTHGNRLGDYQSLDWIEYSGAFNELIKWLQSEKYLIDNHSTTMTEEFEKEHKWELSRNRMIDKTIRKALDIVFQ